MAIKELTKASNELLDALDVDSIAVYAASF